MALVKKDSIVVVGLGLLAVAVTLPSCSKESRVVDSAPSERHELSALGDLEEIASFREWHRVNDSPIEMSPAQSTLCLAVVDVHALMVRPNSGDAPLPSSLSTAQGGSFSVFVNEIGKERLLGDATGEFPVGSILVKEKHRDFDVESSLLLTVMIKREAGYAPEVGDWEFAVLHGGAKGIQARGNPAHCVSCHVGYKDNDFVVADYLDKDSTTASASTRP